MKNIFPFLVLLILSSCALEQVEEVKEIVKKEVLPNDAKQNILFIGNSYTFGNNGVDQGLANLVKDTANYYFTRAAQSRYHLNIHWDDPKTDSIFRLKQWDKVVLQEYSAGPVRQYDEFREYTEKWKGRILEANPKTQIYLFDTWGYKRAPNMSDSLFAAYSQVGEDLDIEVVPVGLFWHQCRTKMNFYEEDAAHPNPYGTFAAACIFYEFLFNKNVKETKYISKALGPARQKNIKRWAHQFVQEFD